MDLNFFLVYLVLVGGGIKMNAGCFGREFKDILISIQAINKSGQVITIPYQKILILNIEIVDYLMI